ncbi:LOW QUALITY PROTEIN: tubulin polyglutamylase TTLL5-like [Dreissena polymorpha]|uniref:LOW QUALITY PROTEIN: tubulin polyglutamylase TTLL5-like n=1 Tax=Dreissena polymorpha TaxID=45954 RepID=UPI002263DC46|nr:LOW QUALITY PROTEIN: tubulin polyglutamylase TTLL5-like [Dreissena polymorpha]
MSKGTVKHPLVFRLNDFGEGPELVRQVFLERGWQEYEEETQHESDWNFWWRTSRFRLRDYENVFHWQRLNHYPNSTVITRKDCLVRNIRRMRGVHGAGVYNFSPLSFNLPNDYTRFVAEYGKLKSKTDANLFSWICKPADLSRGRGIFIFRDISELQYNCNAVVQQYVANPLLIGGYKFDIRLYVAVPSFHPLTFYVYEEGIVRFSTEKFDLSALNNIFSHLTNTSINKHGPQYQTDKERVGPGCKWTVTQLRYYLHQSNIDDRMIWARIINIIILTLLVQAPQVPKQRNCFELYGFDILIDDKLKPWLLEVNYSPALNNDTQIDVAVKKPMLHCLIDMVNFREGDADRGSIDKTFNSRNKRTQGRASANINNNNRQDLERTISSSRLSNHGSMQRMNSTLSIVLSQQETVSFIHQDNLSLLSTNDEKPCFGLPLVHAVEEDEDDQYLSDFEEAQMSRLNCDRGASSPQNHNRSGGMIRSSSGYDREMSKVTLVEMLEEKAKKVSDTDAKGKGDNAGHKKLSFTDSAYSSFSDNSDKNTYGNSPWKFKNHAQKMETNSVDPSEEAAKSSRVTKVYTIKSLRPTLNSISLQKVSNRGVAKGNDSYLPLYKAPGKLPQFDSNKASTKKIPDRSVSRKSLSRLHSKRGSISVRSDLGISRKPRESWSRVSTIVKGEKDLISLSLRTETQLSNAKMSQRSVTISHYQCPPPRIGDFFLVFPFNELTYKTANATLDPHVIIRETQKLMKDMKQQIDSKPGDTNVGGLLPFGSRPDGGRLWSPVRPPPDE